MLKKEALEEKPLECSKFSGTITQKKNPHGKPNLIFSIISQTSSKPTSGPDPSNLSYSGISGRDSFREEGCDTQVNSIFTPYI
jgi:hypothetical protein